MIIVLYYFAQVGYCGERQGSLVLRQRKLTVPKEVDCLSDWRVGNKDCLDPVCFDSKVIANFDFGEQHFKTHQRIILVLSRSIY